MCSANQWDTLKTMMPAAGIGQQKGPNSPWQRLTTCHTTNTSKVEWIGLWCFASSTMIPDLLPSNHHFFKHLDNYLQGKCFPSVHWIPKHGFLCYRNKQTYFSLAKKALIVMVPILINKDVFEPSYNNLKFTIWNCSYICTNPIATNDISYSFLWLTNIPLCVVVIILVSMLCLTLLPRGLPGSSVHGISQAKILE